MLQCALPPSSSSSLSALYQVNNQPLASVLKYKDLDVTVCANLSWLEHIKLITVKAYCSLHLIRKSFSFPSSFLRLHLYLLLVRSQVCYIPNSGDPGCIKTSHAWNKSSECRNTKFLLCDNVWATNLASILSSSAPYGLTGIS